MAINQFQGFRPGIEGVSQALDALATVHKMKQADLANELVKQQIAAGQAQAQMIGEQRDVGSNVSKRAQAERSALYSMLHDSGYDKGNRLAGLGDVVNNQSAYELNNDSALKDYMEFVKGEQSAKGMAARAAPQMEKLAEQKNQNSIDAGAAFDKDPVIQPLQVSMNNLNKAKSILAKKGPLTAQDFNLVVNDYVNANSAGGTSTEGKINRELPDTFAQSWNELKGRAGQFDDLRQDPTGKQLADIVSNNIDMLHGDMKNYVSDRAGSLYQNYGATTNPQVKTIAQNKLKQYAPDKYAELVQGKKPVAQMAGDQTPNPAPNASSPNAPAQDPDALKFSQIHKMPYDQAAAIMTQRKAARANALQASQ